MNDYYESMSAYEAYGDELDYIDEEPARCELDREDGGVCLKRLSKSGACPVHGEGHCGRELGNTNAYCVEKLTDGKCVNEDKHW